MTPAIPSDPHPTFLKAATYFHVKDPINLKIYVYFKCVQYYFLKNVFFSFQINFYLFFY